MPIYDLGGPLGRLAKRILKMSGLGNLVKMCGGRCFRNQSRTSIPAGWRPTNLRHHTRRSSDPSLLGGCFRTEPGFILFVARKKLNEVFPPVLPAECSPNLRAILDGAPGVQVHSDEIHGQFVSSPVPEATGGRSSVDFDHRHVGDPVRPPFAQKFFENGSNPGVAKKTRDLAFAPTRLMEVGGEIEHRVRFLERRGLSQNGPS